MATARFFYKDPDAPSPNRPIGVGVLALIDSAGALLMDRRSDCGGWGLPGGAVAPDEALEALVREVHEETGLAVTDCELFCISADPSRIARYPDGNVVRLLTFAFAARVENLDALRASEESEELAFLRRDELRGANVIETARPIIERYFSQETPQGVLLR
jgi:8-oxo-dGTP pyrophosphatase MutT (NUDIX family)